MNQRTMLRAKIHRIRVTQCEVEYEGSLTLDRDLMDAARMVPYERIEVYDVDSGNRFATYLIEGERGSGVCCVNGAAAHKVSPGNRIILATYTEVAEADVAEHRPYVVLMGEGNRIKEAKRYESAGTRVTG